MDAHFFNKIIIGQRFYDCAYSGEDLGRKWYEDGKLLKKEKYFHRLY
jgi:hypothetical protein